jgi:two-component system nitrate/nitrite response regulator NarL
VIVADDDPIARRGVRDALQSDAVTVIAEAENGRDAVELAAHYEPDVVLMDLVMPVLDGLGATRDLRGRAPGVRVVMLVAPPEQFDVALLCLRTGACGYLTKNVDLASLGRAVRGAAAGEAVISRELATALVRVLQATTVDGVGLRPVCSALTPREWEVLDLMCGQSSTREIAERLVLSQDTVRTHIKHIRRKLDVKSRAEAIDVARSIRREILTDGRSAA